MDGPGTMAVLVGALLEIIDGEAVIKVARAEVNGADPGPYAVQIDYESDPDYYVLKRVPLEGEQAPSP